MCENNFKYFCIKNFVIVNSVINVYFLTLA